MSEIRAIDGSGNNINHPEWGRAGEPLLRNVPAAYEGLDGPSGSGRPNPKLVSDIVCAQSEPVPNENGLTDFMWAWGQFLDHELDLSPSDPREPLPIPTPDGRVIPFSRSIHRSTLGVGLSKPRQQINVLSSYIDAANVYGTNSERAGVLRAFDGSGKLKVVEHGLGPQLPKNPGGVPNDPEAPPEIAQRFFLAGDVRCNEHVVLTCMHTLFVREHNRLCDELKDDERLRLSVGIRGSYGSLASNDAEATDEQIYQHARRIVGGIMQAITYNEFLPALLGQNAIGSYRGYDEQTDASICNLFSTAAYRLGHSMLSPQIQRHGMQPIAFQDLFFSAVPGLIDTDGVEPYLAGLATQRMQRIDTMAIDAVRVHLFANENDPPFDLASLNIQRGRDHGLPDYNTCRAAYGLAPKEDFRDISSDRETQQRLRRAYDGDIRLIDPWIGGLAEDHHQDATVGEFFFHVLREQFVRIRDGDRFWYENDLALSDAEKDEIRNTTLADVIQRNTRVTGLQQNVFRIRDSGAGPRISDSGPSSGPSERRRDKKRRPTNSGGTGGRKKATRKRSR